LHIGIIWTSTD